MEIFGLASLTTEMLVTINCLLFLLCLSAVCFYTYTIHAAIAWLHRRYPREPDFHPPVSILKPICGLDGDAYENLASFCQQDYPTYQIIFAVLESTDPAIEVVQKIRYYFPERDIQLVVSDRPLGMNRKVSNLANAVAHAKYDILLIADSDIRVGTDYLQRVIQPLRDTSVGVVTCLYRSLAQGWVAILEAVGIATDFHAGVLVATKLEGIKFAMGSSIVIRQAVLDKIGGFEAIADYLADDFQLGNLPTQVGYQVVLSDYVVDHVLAKSTLADSIRRQIRWARGTRVSRPWGYLGLIFTHGIVASLLLLIMTGGSIFAWIVLAVTWLIRLVMGWVVGVTCLNDSVAKTFVWLIPLRDLISFAVWCSSFVGNRIEWRGKQWTLTKGGKLVPLSGKS